MATPAVGNIIKSGAVLWYAPTGTTKPDTDDIAYNEAWGGDWVRVGFTKEPLTAAYTSEEADINVQEHLAPVKRWRIGESLVLETVLSELTADYLQLAASEQDGVSETAADDDTKAFEQTGLGGVAALTEREWGFEGLFIDSDGNNQPVRFFVHKGTAMLNGNLEFSKKTDDYVGVPIQIKALADTSQSAGEELGLFQRITSNVTA